MVANGPGHDDLLLSDGAGISIGARSHRGIRARMVARFERHRRYSFCNVAGLAGTARTNGRARMERRQPDSARAGVYFLASAISIPRKRGRGSGFWEAVFRELHQSRQYDRDLASTAH